MDEHGIRHSRWHYRLTDNQTRDMFEKFSFTGWPSYLLIDKKGNFQPLYKVYADESIMTKAIDKSLIE